MSFDETSDPENDVPDWLKGLEPEEDAAGFEPEPEKVPSWFEEEDTSDRASTGQEGDVPEWLANIREQEGSASEEEEEEPPVETGSLSREDKEETEDWLENIRQKYARDTGRLELPEDFVAPDSDDYMDRIRELKEQDQPSEPEAEDKDPFGGLEGDKIEDLDGEDFDWGIPEPHTPAPETPAGIWGDAPESEEEEGDQGPDWLSGLPTFDTEELPRDFEEKTPDDFDVPDWLQGMGSERAELELPDSGPADEETPEWLGSVAAEEPAEPEPPVFESADVEAAAEAVDEEYPDLPGEPGEGALPNWLETLEFSPEEEEVPELDGGGAIVESYSEEDVSSLLFEPDDLPDWLQEETPAEVTEEEEQPPAPVELPPPDDDDEIARAELPSWLQAMRPIEAVTATVVDEIEEAAEVGDKERVGPLSGLADVLPAEPHIVHFGTKAVPVTGFEISEVQKSYARILQEMVKAEAATPPVQRRKVAIPQQMLRWIIAILLMVVTFFGTWAISDLFALPAADMPIEQLDVITRIDALPPDAQVLVAFEYQPGFSGEMESAAYAVVDHLLLRGVNLSLVSTQPTGPDLAERFLNSKMEHHPYVVQQQFANLGYISGGAAGLLNFAANPRAAVTLLDDNGFSLWDQPPLNTIQDIRSYALVMVITEDPDIARSWVEQVQPLLDPEGTGTGTPLVMVVSAQAEPLVYPFYQSNPKQVAGIVSGVVGGAYYENVTGITEHQGVAENYWFAYNIAMLIAIVLIGGISLINLFGVIVRSRISLGRRGSTS
jgi:hypothetical protein